MLTLCVPDNFCSLRILFKINFFENFFQEYTKSFKQSGLVWIQTVFNIYQQTTLVDKELKIYGHHPGDQFPS